MCTRGSSVNSSPASAHWVRNCTLGAVAMTKLRPTFASGHVRRFRRASTRLTRRFEVSFHSPTASARRFFLDTPICSGLNRFSLVIGAWPTCRCSAATANVSATPPFVRISAHWAQARSQAPPTQSIECNSRMILDSPHRLRTLSMLSATATSSLNRWPQAHWRLCISHDSLKISFSTPRAKQG